MKTGLSAIKEAEVFSLKRLTEVRTEVLLLFDKLESYLKNYFSSEEKALTLHNSKFADWK